jgi:hypothetical protein
MDRFFKMLDSDFADAALQDICEDPGRSLISRLLQGSDGQWVRVRVTSEARAAAKMISRHPADTPADRLRRLRYFRLQASDFARLAFPEVIKCLVVNHNLDEAVALSVVMEHVESITHATEDGAWAHDIARSIWNP